MQGQSSYGRCRFTKDVDADQIKFSSLSKAYLDSLVLDEEVITDVLELPAWLKISRIVCNRVSLHVNRLLLNLMKIRHGICFHYRFYQQIPWTQLSSQPIQIVSQCFVSICNFGLITDLVYVINCI